MLTIGKLDGFHAGHRHLAAHAQAEADRLGARAAAVVLHPDPATVLTGRPVPRLSTIEDRVARLRAFGVEVVEPLLFTSDVAACSAEGFLDRLAERFVIAGMVVGPDFAFGRDRGVDVAALAVLAARRGFELKVVPPLDVAGERASSRRVRALIEAGDIDLARLLLRLPPRLVGTVVHGAARGRGLGYPTANLDLVAEFVVPADGIYAVGARWRDGAGAVRHAPGVASIGVRPTFDNGERSVEVHLLDFDGDLYAREMAVDFLRRQRPELRFDSATSLVDQMGRDAALAREDHAREARPVRSRPASDGSFTVAGRDLAALCEHVSRLLAPADTADARDGTSRARDDAPPTPGPVPAPPAGVPAVRGSVPASAGRVPSTPGAVHRTTVALTGATDDALLQAWWHTCVDTAASGRALVDASVYQAGAGTLHALLRSVARAAGGGSTRGGILLGEVGLRADGWLEVTATPRAAGG